MKLVMICLSCRFESVARYFSWNGSKSFKKLHLLITKTKSESGNACRNRECKQKDFCHDQCGALELHLMKCWLFRYVVTVSVYSSTGDCWWSNWENITFSRSSSYSGKYCSTYFLFSIQSTKLLLSYYPFELFYASRVLSNDQYW